VTDTDLSPTKLRLAINERGTVEHVLVEQSCGEEGATIAKDLDQQATTAARKIRFAPVEQPGLQWALVTVFWRYSAKPREEVVPTPPTPQ
jgi:outer membrane biosynthesis protein TonB